MEALRPLALARKRPPENKQRTIICQESEQKTGRGRWCHKLYRGTNGGRTPQGMTGTWAQAEGFKGGKNGRRKWQKTQAHGVGRRVKRRRLARGEIVKHPGGRNFAPGEEVGSGYNRKR